MNAEYEVERWMPVLEYETLYSVSSHGRVRNDRSGRILRPGVNSNGYHKVNLCRNGLAKNQKVHRLCAVVFIENPENKLCVDHINGIRTDNRVENLRWATHTENNRNGAMLINNKSGVKGVSWDTKSNKWRAQIRDETGRKQHLGYFNSIDDAEAAVVTVRTRMHGEFASTRNNRDDSQSVSDISDL